jgi:N-acetyl-anhydromuramyl-L-alanine amidase AmpD
MVGGIDNSGNPENNFTAYQFESLAFLVQMLRRAYPVATVVGHRDLSPDLDGDGIIEEHEWLKDCPCFVVKDWLLTLGEKSG